MRKVELNHHSSRCCLTYCFLTRSGHRRTPEAEGFYLDRIKQRGRTRTDGAPTRCQLCTGPVRSRFAEGAEHARSEQQLHFEVVSRLRQLTPPFVSRSAEGRLSLNIGWTGSTPRETVVRSRSIGSMDPGGFLLRSLIAWQEEQRADMRVARSRSGRTVLAASR